MNIFFLDKNPVMAATYHHDKHIVKMPLETAQILSTVLRLKGLEYDWLYKPTHKMHKCVVWAASDWNNFYWLCRFGIALCDEYTYRYNKIHKSKQVIINCLNVLYWVYERKSLNSNKITSPAQVMPEKYQNVDPVVAYRNYYLFEKEFWYKRDKKTKKIISKHLNTWTKRNQPNWWVSSNMRKIKEYSTRKLMSIRENNFYYFKNNDNLVLELSQREHIPDKVESKKNRQNLAKKYSKGRASHKKINDKTYENRTK